MHVCSFLASPNISDAPICINVLIFLLPVSARALTGTGTVSIFVEDTNDNPPIYEHDSNYVAHIKEESLVDTEVVVVTATDKDEGANAQIM